MPSASLRTLFFVTFAVFRQLVIFLECVDQLNVMWKALAEAEEELRNYKIAVLEPLIELRFEWMKREEEICKCESACDCLKQPETLK